MQPNAITAASLNRQSKLNMFSFTKGITNGIIESSVQFAISDKQTPAALEGTQSSSSSNSSYKNKEHFFTKSLEINTKKNHYLAQ